MKSILKTLIISALFFVGTPGFTQSPPPPPSDAKTGGGGSDGPVGGPIDGGLGILLALGAAYGGRKLYLTRKEKSKSDAHNLT